MKLPPLLSKGLVGLSMLAFSAIASAGALNVLADGGRVKPSIKVAESYVEKVLKIRIPGEGTFLEQVASSPVSATIVGNLEGVDVTGFNDDTPVEFSIGSFVFEETLGNSEEARKAGGTFPANKKKATFVLGFEDVDANDNPVFRKVGTVTFSWGKGKLVVKLKCKDAINLELGEVAASEYTGLYEDESENGNKPSGSVKFEGEPVDCTVTLGTAGGFRSVLISGTSATKFKVFGRGDEAEEFFLESVKLTGKTGPVVVLP